MFPVFLRALVTNMSCHDDKQIFKVKEKKIVSMTKVVVALLEVEVDSNTRI